MMEASSKLNCTFCDNSDIRNVVIFIESTDSFHNKFDHYEVRGTRGVLHKKYNKSEFGRLAITSSPRSPSWGGRLRVAMGATDECNANPIGGNVTYLICIYFYLWHQA